MFKNPHALILNGADFSDNQSNEETIPSIPLTQTRKHTYPFSLENVSGAVKSIPILETMGIGVLRLQLDL